MDPTLSFIPYEMPAADLGRPNPLPDMSRRRDVHAGVVFDESIPENERASFLYGRVSTSLPYLTQDGYDRIKKPRAFNSAVLENDHIKAVFLPELGGRLWSLYDKDAGRQLLHVNPVFQPANLAIRNAWISGGVEWNIGILGHSPFTVSPVFAAAYRMSDGTPVLRMYEWERVRSAAFVIDAFLPKDSKFLFLRIQIINTRAKETPMYWWSNTAVDEKPDVRVIAPADRAYGHNYDKKLAKVDVPVSDGIDKSYTTRVPRAMDWFFDIPADRRKWECAVDGNGRGLVQASTERLVGRKLFLWGDSAGGKRWQEFLSAPGCSYLEIQAGVIQTQMQNAAMPALAKWDWLESYGPICTDPVVAHGEWKRAYEHITEMLDEKLPLGTLESYLDKARAEGRAANVELKSYGSGWAALEAARAFKTGDGFDVENLVFPEDSINDEQSPWLELLRTGTFPEPGVGAEPSSYMIQPEWLDLLTESIERGKSDHWYSWLQLGVIHFANGENEKAESAFNSSLERRPNAWALRNLAALRGLGGDAEGAARELLEAVGLLPQKHIVIECGKALIAAGMHAEFAAFERELPTDLRNHGRVRVQKIEALIRLGELDAAREIFDADLTVNDVREGEVLLSDLWTLLHRKMIAREQRVDESAVTDAEALGKYPLPENIDFRMSGAK